MSASCPPELTPINYIIAPHLLAAGPTLLVENGVLLYHGLCAADPKLSGAPGSPRKLIKHKS